jgi:hypothetical protein
MKKMHFSFNSIKGRGCYWEDPECCQGRPYTLGQRIHPCSRKEGPCAGHGHQVGLHLLDGKPLDLSEELSPGARWHWKQESVPDECTVGAGRRAQGHSPEGL